MSGQYRTQLGTPADSRNNMQDLFPEERSPVQDSQALRPLAEGISLEEEQAAQIQPQNGTKQL